MSLNGTAVSGRRGHTPLGVSPVPSLPRQFGRIYFQKIKLAEGIMARRYVHAGEDVSSCEKLALQISAIGARKKSQVSISSYGRTEMWITK